MSDLISRQAAIEYFMTNTNWHDEDGYEIHDAADKRALLKSYFDGIPSAQPEPSTEIQEILNYLDTTLHPIVSPNNWNVYAELHDMVSRLPSAKPEPLTDKEQRIFLAAMAREEKVCKLTDEECRNCREAYEDSLVWVCKEIVRKVKGALWQT